MSEDNSNKKNSRLGSDFFKESLDFFFKFNNKDTLGASSGLKRIDKATEGFFGLTAVTGVPGKGKTTFAIQTAAYNLFELKKPVIILSLEVSKQMFLTKLMTYLSGLQTVDVLKGGYTYDEANRYIDSMEQLSNSDNFTLLGQSEASFDALRDAIDYSKETHEERYGESVEPLVVVDYINIFHDTNGEKATSDNEKIKHQMSEFIKLKNETGANFIIIAAKNKNGYKSAEMSSMKGGNDLEYGLETIISLEDVPEDFPVSNYPMEDNGFIEVNTLAVVLKNRWGNASSIPLYFKGSRGRFYEPTLM